MLPEFVRLSQGAKPSRDPCDSVQFFIQLCCSTSHLSILRSSVKTNPSPLSEIDFILDVQKSFKSSSRPKSDPDSDWVSGSGLLIGGKTWILTVHQTQSADMEFVQKFTPLDFQAKNFTPSISPNLDYSSLDYSRLQGHSDYRDIWTIVIWTIAVWTILDYRDVWTTRTIIIHLFTFAFESYIYETDFSLGLSQKYHF